MKEESYTDFYREEEKPVDYKAIVFEYLLHWPVILACLVVFVAGCFVFLGF